MDWNYNKWLTPLHISDDIYNTEFNHYYKWLLKLSLALFKYDNLPFSVSERALELICQTHGKVLWCTPNLMGLVVLQSTESNLNIYGQGQKYAISTPVPVSPKEYTIDDAVMMYNDDFADSMIEPLSIYAKRLADLEQVKRVNQAQLMTPTIVPVEDKKRNSYNNAIQKMQGGALAIFSGKGIEWEKLKSLDLGAKFYLDKLQEDKMKVWNEALTFIGIDNSNNEKKERMITDEATSNNYQTQGSRNTRLKARELAIEKVNEMFKDELDKPIEVSLRLDTLQEAEKMTKMMEGNNDDNSKNDN